MGVTDARHADDVASEKEAEQILAAIVNAPGDEPRVGRIPAPMRATGSTLLQVIAAPLNPLDLLIASGTFHSARHELPYVPGSECVGIVMESDRYAVGSQVYAECHPSPETPGAFAARVAVNDDDVLPLPGGLDPVQAAAIGNSGVAAYLPLLETAGIRHGDTVLVLGATGAVGRLAVQIANLNGAGRVIGVARDVAALEHIRLLGADAVVELRAGEDADSLASRVRQASGPVDVVFDGLYGVPLEAALQACAPRARVVNVGNSAGATAEIPAGLLRGRQLTVVGFAGLHTPLREKRPALEWLWSALRDARLRNPVSTLPIERIQDAWRAQSRSPHGKFVVLPQGIEHVVLEAVRVDRPDINGDESE